MLIVLKVALCVMLVEIGLLIANRVARIVVRGELPPPRPRPALPPRVPRPAPVLRVVVPPDAPPSRVPPLTSPPAPVPGVELEGVAVQPMGSQCRVCAHEIDERLVICGRCEAPHHAECWTYNEGCSTYGCSSVVARAASGC